MYLALDDERYAVQAVPAPSPDAAIPILHLLLVPYGGEGGCAWCSRRSLHLAKGVRGSEAQKEGSAGAGSCQKKKILGAPPLLINHPPGSGANASQLIAGSFFWKAPLPRVTKRP